MTRSNFASHALELARGCIDRSTETLRKLSPGMAIPSCKPNIMLLPSKNLDRCHKHLISYSPDRSVRIIEILDTCRRIVTD